MREQKRTLSYAIVCAAAAAAFALAAGDAVAAKRKGGPPSSDFWRQAYETNACLAIGDFIVPIDPASDVRASSDCMSAWATQNPLGVIRDEVVITSGQLDFGGAAATVIGEPCRPEPQVALYGTFESLYNDPNGWVLKLMNKVVASIAAKCATAPSTLHVKFRRRTMQDDPAHPATRKVPPGRMVVVDDVFSGRYLNAANNVHWEGDDANQIVPGRPGGGYVARSASDARADAAALYALEHPAELQEAIGQLFQGVAKAEWFSWCADLVQRGNPRKILYSQETWDYCEKVVKGEIKIE